MRCLMHSDHSSSHRGSSHFSLPSFVHLSILQFWVGSPRLCGQPRWHFIETLLLHCGSAGNVNFYHWGFCGWSFVWKQVSLMYESNLDVLCTYEQYFVGRRTLWASSLRFLYVRQSIIFSTQATILQTLACLLGDNCLDSCINIHSILFFHFRQSSTTIATSIEIEVPVDCTPAPHPVVQSPVPAVQNDLIEKVTDCQGVRMSATKRKRLSLHRICVSKIVFPNVPSFQEPSLLYPKFTLSSRGLEAASRRQTSVYELLCTIAGFDRSTQKRLRNSC